MQEMKVWLACLIFMTIVQLEDAKNIGIEIIWKYSFKWF
jgi:hypothetical protein